MPLFSRFLWLALTFGAALPPALAQTKAATTPATSSAVLPASFALGPGDVIALTVSGLPELSSDALALSATGRVTLPLIGALTIKDKTLEQARHAIETAYKAQLRNPRVTLKLVRAAARQATILGAVARPGAVNLQVGWRVSDALSAAGGLSVAPDAVAATLKRLGAPPIALDVAAIISGPQSRANAFVVAGDVISFAPLPSVNITINGDVGAPGAQSYRAAPRLLEALARAGNLERAPADTNISLLRDGVMTALDVAAASRAPGSDSDIFLRDGDLLSVRSVALNVSVLSDEALVQAPGNYPLQGRSNFSRALEAAGGTTARADRIVATVRRGNQIIPIDVARALYDREADIALQNNDILVLKPAPDVRVRLMGEVKSPGKYDFPETAIADALRQAGGLTVAPQDARIAVLRTLPGGRQIALQVDAARLMANDVSQNLQLKDADIVTVQARDIASVAVTGEVENPGIYPLAPGDGLTRALADAGGTGALADLRRVTIARDGQPEQIADHSQPATGAAPDISLQDGDRVRVPKNPDQVLLIDAVARPGIYAIAVGTTLTLSEAITRAGGPAPGAQLGEIALLRRAPVAPQTPQGYALSRVKFDADEDTGAVALQPGDVILVPAAEENPPKIAQAIRAVRAFDASRGFEF